RLGAGTASRFFTCICVQLQFRLRAWLCAMSCEGMSRHCACAWALDVSFTCRISVASAHKQAPNIHCTRYALTLGAPKFGVEKALGAHVVGGRRPSQRGLPSRQFGSRTSN